LSSLTLSLQRHIKELVTTCATHVLDNGGVVRSLNNWGTRVLPSRMNRHQQWHTMGEFVARFHLYSNLKLTSCWVCSYWTMHFDTSPRVLHALNRRLRQDPRVIRCTMTKLGEKIEDIAEPKEQSISRIPSTEDHATKLQYQQQPNLQT
jgi:small subunit ribosomal protein S6